MTGRKVKKNTEDDDTCRDCWRRRFRSDLMDQLGTAGKKGSEFFDVELSLREKLYDEMRREARDIYEEITEIRTLAGDVYMDRYKKEKD